MDDKRGFWYVLSIMSVPWMLLSRTGVFGARAKAESDLAFSDWAGYGRVLIRVGLTLMIVALLAYRFLG